MKTRQVFFTLLRSGLWNQAIADFEGFPLSADQWQILYKHAINHTVEGILYQGMLTLPKEFMPPRALILSWTVRLEQIEKRNAWMNKEVTKQLKLFRAHNLDPVLLKGQGVARCYEKPEIRLAGDVDWYFSNREDYNRARMVLVNHGITVKAVPGYSSYAVWNETEIELHRRMIDIHNPWKKPLLNRLLKTEAELAQSVRVDDMNWKLPSPILMHLSINVHILKHLLAYGIGLRQLCDAARICYSYAGKFCGDTLKRTYKKLGVLHFINVLHNVLVDYLGLPEEHLPFPRLKHAFSETMIRDIWQAGNFGFSIDASWGDEAKRAGGTMRIWKNLWKYLPFAPMEAITFPAVQLYSRFHN